MLKAITGIDHVGIDPGDVWQAFARFARLGFTVSTPSRFRGVPVESCQVTFDGHFLSLSTSFLDPKFADAEWVARTKPVGVTELMLGTTDMAAVRHELQTQFADLLPGHAAADVERRIFLERQIRHQRFRILVLAPGSAPGMGTLGFCEHLTPHWVWRPELWLHANGAMGISRLTFQHPDPPALEPALARLFGESALQASGDRIELRLAGMQLHFVTARQLQTRVAGFDGWSQLRAPALKMIDFQVRELDRCREHLQFMGVALLPDERERLVVDPSEACGFLLRFTAPG